MNALAIPGSAALSASSQPFSNEGPYRPMLHAPIGSGFGAASTAAEVIAGRDLSGKTVVVTGGYSGIGLETVRAFRSAGAKVLVPARDIAKAKADLAKMPDVRLEIMDLVWSKYSSGWNQKFFI